MGTGGFLVKGGSFVRIFFSKKLYDSLGPTNDVQMMTWWYNWALLLVAIRKILKIIHRTLPTFWGQASRWHHHRWRSKWPYATPRRSPHAPSWHKGRCKGQGNHPPRPRWEWWRPGEERHHFLREQKCKGGEQRKICGWIMKNIRIVIMINLKL